MDIYINRDGNQFGPYQQTDVEQMLTDGGLSESDLIWCESLENWVPLSSLITKSAQVQPDSSVMPDSVAAVSGAAVAVALLRPDNTQAHNIDTQPTNVAPVNAFDISDSSSVSDAGVPPPLPAVPPPLPPDAFRPPIIDEDADVVVDDLPLEQEFDANLVEPEFDIDMDIDLPDIDMDFDF